MIALIQMLNAILVRHTTTIILLLFCQNLFGQIKLGTYSQIDTSLYADLELYPENKFDFYDTRNGSCFVWTHTIGQWKSNKDTIIFSWQSTWTENSDSIISSRNLKNKNVEVTFLYDNGKPISNVKVSLSCDFDNNKKTYLTDAKGKVTIPQKQSLGSDKKMCPGFERMLYFDVKNSIIKLSSNTSLDYYADSLDNVLTVVIKRNPKTTYKTETKKYLVKDNTLVDIDPKEFYNYNWGDFKFATTKYGR